MRASSHILCNLRYLPSNVFSGSLSFKGPTFFPLFLASLMDLSDILHLDVDGCEDGSSLEVNG